MNERWNLIAQREDELLRQLVDGATVESNEFESIESEILSLLAQWPSEIAKFNSQGSQEQEATMEFVDSLAKVRKQAQLGASIIHELKGNPSQAKLRNMVMAWSVRNAL